MAGRRIALLVATDGYVDPGLNQLRSPARGASELEALLRDEAVGRFDFVRTLTNRPKEEIEREIEALLSNRAPDDLILLYLACHGIRNDTDRLFFATIGTNLSRPHTTAIRADLIHQLLDECEARTKIVLLDCCYSGLFHRATPMSPAPVDVEAALVGRGTFVITASTALEYAYEGDQLTLDNAQPVARFTAAIIEGLRTGLADLDRDGVITPDELYTYVHDAVVNQSGPEQTPTKSGQYEGHVPIAYAARTDFSIGLPPQGARTNELVLGTLLPPPVDTPDRGFICDSWEGASRLIVPIGRTATASGSELMRLDLSHRSGNVAVVGRLGSGKTTLLRVLAMSLALTHTPHEAEFYLLEGAVNRLGVLRSMPHVRKVAAAHEHETVAEALTALKDAVAARRALFRDLDVDSVEEYRELRAAGRLPLDSGSDVFLVIDGWLDFHWEIPDFAQEVHRLANTGLNYGLHVLVSARRWSDFGTSLLGLLGTRVELPLDDPSESQIDSTLSASLGVGWGLSLRRRFRVAVPHLEEVTSSAEARQAMAETTQRMRERWLGVQPDTTPRRRADIQFTQLFGIRDATRFDVDRAWAPRPPQERLRVPIGVSQDGRPVMLDLKEPAQGGIGPHGLCVGATGSGKSELLRTLVLGLAVTHSSETLNFVLVDFKGGATFAGMSQLPHVSAVITNLEGELTLVDRMRDAISGELLRRQELLQAAGNYSNISQYEKARAAGASLDPLPSLLIVIDEFSELLVARPEFIDLFVQIGRIGRSLGVHLLLSSQRLEEGKLRGLETFLSYRIGLRTFSAAESRTAIGVADAYHLPPVPGSGYLKHDNGQMTRFRAAYVSGVYTPGAPSTSNDTSLEDVSPDGQLDMDAFKDRLRDMDVFEDSLLDVLVRQLEGRGLPAHQIWLPPLDDPATLDQLLPELAASQERGLHPPAYQGLGRLRVPVGLVDRPDQQRREVMYLDFSAAAGHGLIVGAPQTGKSTLLRTVICALALTHTPSEVQFYCLDFGGGGMQPLQHLPHIGGVASRLDPERVRRTVAEVAGVLARREEFFRTQGIDSMAAYRTGRATGKWPDQPWGDVFLVIDGWSSFKREYEQLEETILDLGTRGLAYGVHLLLTTTRYADVRSALRDYFGTRVELRLADPMESEIARKVAANVPVGVPGRGLTSDEFHFLAAVPRLGYGPNAPAGLAEATADFSGRIRSQWTGPIAPPVRALPALLSAEALPPDFGRSKAEIALGLDETTLLPFGVDFETDPYLVVFGESESGKTSLLRLLVQKISERYTPQEAQLVVVDYRRSLLGDLPADYVTEYIPNGLELPSHVTALTDLADKRMPPPHVTPEELRNRSWYTTPDIFLLVDDYDLVSTASGNPLLPLLEYLPFARDIGFRMVLCRNSAGAGRSMYEPVMQYLREQGARGLTLSGDKSEGALIGSVTPHRRPPGRGTLTGRRDLPRQVQLAFQPPRGTLMGGKKGAASAVDSLRLNVMEQGTAATHQPLDDAALVVPPLAASGLDALRDSARPSREDPRDKT
ncbi:type VII secretion protein EccCb [Streptomyces sp. NPDC012756]|uniref:type VII secretion protein EccCb n=1 Tax=Streptomyces sp. NPDC012756 TaxID=3364847 RepID=UPI0036B7D473